jgi:hypothetical protein
MDWHKLQQTLFEIDPTDPREDLAKLQQAAQGGAAGDVPPTKDYLKESVEVTPGSMPLGIDSVADFAALAGVKVDEGIWDNAKRDFRKGYAIGQDTSWLTDKIKGAVKQTTGQEPPTIKTKASPKADPNVVPMPKELLPYADELIDITKNPLKLKRLEKFLQGSKVPEAKQELPKERNPVVTNMQKSGQGVHKDKKKVLPRKEKHKNKQYESIKEELYARLAEIEKKNELS